VAHHENYFRESPAPDTCPTTKEAGFAIIPWDVLIIDEEPMPCYAPVISPEGDVVHVSYLSMLMLQPLLADVLAMGRAGWSRAHRELEERKFMEAEPWRLGITEEIGTAHMRSDGET
jgi:hypothetical protein